MMNVEEDSADTVILAKKDIYYKKNSITSDSMDLSERGLANYKKNPLFRSLLLPIYATGGLCVQGDQVLLPFRETTTFQPGAFF